MALSERLALLIDINGASAVAELNKVGAAADKELGRAEDRTQRMGAKFQQVGIGMMATAGVIGAGLYSAGKGAAELEQAVGGTEAVFASSSKVIDTWAKGADTAAGLSEQSARRLTTQIGGALQGLGFAQDEAAEKSIELTQIGADLSATYGGTTVDAVQALGSALRGEFDPMEQFNVFLKQSEIDAKAVEMGLAKNTTEVDKNARAQATLALITEQSGAAQGQFGREANTASGQMAIMEAQTQNAKDAMGAGLLPVMSKVAGVVGGGAQKFLELDSAMGGNLSTGAAVGVGLLAVGGALSTTIGWVIKAKTGFVDAASGVKDLLSNLKTLPGAIGAVSFTAAAGGAYLLTQRLQENTSAAQEWAKQFAGPGTIPEQLARTQEKLASFRAEAESFASVDAFGQSWWGSNEGREMGDRLDALTAQEAALKGQIDAATNAADLQARGVDAMGNEIEGATEPVDDLTAAVEESEKAYNDAAKAVERFWNPGFDLGEAEIRASEAHQSLNDALIENGVTLDLASEAGRNNRRAFMEAAEAAIDYGMKIFESSGSVEEATTATNGHIQGLRDQMLQAGFTKGQVDLYIAALKLTPEQVATQFSTPGLDAANQAAQALIDKLRQLARDAVMNLNPFSGSTRSGAGLATGGSTMPFSIHPVGEDGAELIDTGGSKYFVSGSKGGTVTPVGPASSAWNPGPGNPGDREYVTFEDGSSGWLQMGEDGRWFSEAGRERKNNELRAAMEYAAWKKQDEWAGAGAAAAGLGVMANWPAEDVRALADLINGGGRGATARGGTTTQTINLVVDGRVLAQVMNDYNAGLN